MRCQGLQPVCIKDSYKVLSFKRPFSSNLAENVCYPFSRKVWYFYGAYSLPVQSRASLIRTYENKQMSKNS